MRCPECGAQAADNAAFCPKCDHILDPSLFSDDFSEEVVEAADGDTNPRIHLSSSQPEDTNPRIHLSSSPSSSPASTPASTPSSTRPPSKPTTRTSSSRKKLKPSQETPDKPASISTSNTPPANNEALAEQWLSERPEKGDFNEAEMLLNALKADFITQSGPDKLLIVGALGMVLSCFFPWQSLEHSGEVLGFLSLGAFIVPLAMGSVGGMLWRKRSHGIFPLLPWFLQGLSGLIAVLLCLVLAKVFWVSKETATLLGANVESSTPSLGLLIGLMFAIINLTGTGMGLKRNEEAEKV